MKTCDTSEVIASLCHTLDIGIALNTAYPLASTDNGQKVGFNLHL